MTLWDLETLRQYHIQSPKRGSEAGESANRVTGEMLSEILLQ